ncbi:hypothetical protein PEC301899_13800 [Pectobacterium carotovorum subsp. carotovorum]|nr:hypothetical protein PEC301899_13800 [Pectobacterium carotovorum subsp. carotovorum]
MALTDVVARTAKPREKAYKLADAHGLYLLVSPNGSKRWYLKYRFEGKESRFAFGEQRHQRVLQGLADVDAERVVNHADMRAFIARLKQA